MFELRDVDFVQESTDPFSISFCPSEKNLNINGTVHGGVLFTICDEIIGRYATHLGRKGAAGKRVLHPLQEELCFIISVRSSARLPLRCPAP